MKNLIKLYSIILLSVCLFGVTGISASNPNQPTPVTIDTNSWWNLIPGFQRLTDGTINFGTKFTPEELAKKQQEQIAQQATSTTVSAQPVPVQAPTPSVVVEQAATSEQPVAVSTTTSVQTPTIEQEKISPTSSVPTPQVQQPAKSSKGWFSNWWGGTTNTNPEQPVEKSSNWFSDDDRTNRWIKGTIISHITPYALHASEQYLPTKVHTTAATTLDWFGKFGWLNMMIDNPISEGLLTYIPGGSIISSASQRLSNISGLEAFGAAAAITGTYYGLKKVYNWFTGSAEEQVYESVIEENTSDNQDIKNVKKQFAALHDFYKRFLEGCQLVFSTQDTLIKQYVALHDHVTNQLKTSQSAQLQSILATLQGKEILALSTKIIQERKLLDQVALESNADFTAIQQLAQKIVAPNSAATSGDGMALAQKMKNFYATLHGFMNDPEVGLQVIQNNIAAFDKFLKEIQADLES